MSGYHFDPDALLKEAKHNAGLSDFGDDGFREPLRVLCESLNREADLSPGGEHAAHGQILGLLENRLKMTEDRRLHPQIGEVRIERPVFIVGLPRSCTSIVHELLRRDPGNRVPLTWEARLPSPPPESATYDSDPRIAEAAVATDALNAAVPELKTMVSIGATTVTECTTFMAHEFTCDLFDPSFGIPTYRDWLWTRDFEPVYQAHRRFLQHLQWRCPRERWVLKAPTHLRTLDALFAVYPDARIVWNHRDPLLSLASVVSLRAAMLSLNVNHVDRQALAQWVTTDNWEWLERGMDSRERLNREAQFFDVYFDRFMADPFETISGIYAQFGMDLSPRALDAMRLHLAENPREKHGPHQYRFDDCGLDPAEERRRYARYQERFRIASEF
jgi:hypothetical protein